MPSLSCCTVFTSSPADARSTVPSATCQGISHHRPVERKSRVRPAVWPCSAGSVLTFDHLSAGMTPMAAAVTSDTPHVKSTTFRSVDTSTSPAMNWLAMSGASPRAINDPRSPPATPPIAASIRCSASNCRSSRRRPAPSDDRMASSFCRDWMVVPSSVDTLRQPIARMSTEKSPIRRRRLSGARVYHWWPRGMGCTTATSSRRSAFHRLSSAADTVASESGRSSTPASPSHAEAGPSIAVLPSMGGACVSGTQMSGL